MRASRPCAGAARQSREMRVRYNAGWAFLVGTTERTNIQNIRRRKLRRQLNGVQNNKTENLQRKNHNKMTNPITTNLGSATTDPNTTKTVLLGARNGKPLGICRLLLLGTALLGLLPTLQASDWGFNLIGKPSAEITTGEEQDAPEVIQMTGAGKFNPEAETASGGGAWAVFNAFAASFGGPTFRGTWEVTDFVGWTPDGRLQVLATLTFNVGLNAATKEVGLALPNVLVTISEEGINVAVGSGLFSTNMTGSARFHLKKR